MTIDPTTYRWTGNRPGVRALMIGAIGLVLGVLAYANDAPRFFHSYLTAYMFWLTIGLGALFFVMLEYLVAAQWSVALRRLVESVMMVIPFMALFFIPIAFGMHDLFHWSHADAVAHDELLQHKEPFLNPVFFGIRAVIYFAVWFALAFSLHRASVADDSGYDEKRRLRTRRIAAGGMILFAFTTTFAAFDWLMSLDAHWYSTIFGAYIFAGAVVGTLCFVTLILIFLRRKGILSDVITVEHFNDLGKLTFAFMIFWAYMAFSQYFLIWYANIPEETIWFAHRWVGSWKVVSLLLVFGHFVIPFFLLLPKTWKRNLTFLGGMSIWLLAMHWVDLYWIVLPGLLKDGARISWMDPVLMVGIGGIFVGLFWRQFSANALVPVGDPKLTKSIHSESP
ncbi:MAG: hypothetical protein Kow0074_03560 [Candidatus Zixiibacteriota bacterium]